MEEQTRHQMTDMPKQEEKSKARQLLPLFIVFALIGSAAFGIQLYKGNFVLTDFLRLFVAFFFITFGFFKTLDWKGFAGAFAEYDLIAMHSRPYAYAYPLIELTLGTLYLKNSFPLYTNLVAIVILSIGALGVYKALADKKKIRCACLGVVIKLPMTTVTLIEDIGMGVMALAMILLV